MKLLLDTHALIWWARSPDDLSRSAYEGIGQADVVVVSSITIYEIVLKFHLGKLPIAAPLVADMGGYLAGQRFDTLNVSPAHAEQAGSLPLVHRDPFDRLLAAQALVEELTLVSNDTALDAFGVRRLW